MSYAGGDAMQTLQRGFRAKGAGWLRQELAKKTVTQLRELGGAAGIPRRSDGRVRNKEELVHALSQRISEQEALWGKPLFCPVHSWFPCSARVCHIVCIPRQVRGHDFRCLELASSGACAVSLD